MREFFPPVNSVYWWQATYEWGSVHCFCRIFVVRQMTGFESYPYPYTYTQDSSPVIVLFVKSGSLCGVQGVLGVWIRPGNEIVASFSLQWKSDESTKHYITQMLLAINWRYRTGEKKFTHAYEGSCKHASLKYTRFSQKKVGYFLTPLVY